MQMHYMQTQISVKKKKTKEKMYLGVEYRPMHAFMLRHTLHVIVQTNALACRCVDVQMCCVCVQTCMSGEKKRKKNNLLMGWGWSRRGTGMRMAVLACGRRCVACGCG